MKLLGIDPGTASTGYAILEILPPGSAKLLETAVISTPAGGDMHKRLKQLFRELKAICVKHSPDIMIVEKLFFNTNVKTAMTVGQARGIALLVAAEKNMLLAEYTALQAKRVLTGYGRASKQEMQEAVKKHLDLPKAVKPDDANDAVAIALCHLFKL